MDNADGPIEMTAPGKRVRIKFDKLAKDGWRYEISIEATVPLSEPDDVLESRLVSLSQIGERVGRTEVRKKNARDGFETKEVILPDDNPPTKPGDSAPDDRADVGSAPESQPDVREIGSVPDLDTASGQPEQPF